MTKEKACLKIRDLINENKEEYLWGGGENKDGCLGYGYIDFNLLNEKIQQIVRSIE